MRAGPPDALRVEAGRNRSTYAGGQTAIALHPASRVSPVDVKKSPADAVYDTELDGRDAQYDVDCEEQQPADNGDEYGADAHAKYFLFVFSSRAAGREQVGKLQSETEFCAGTFTRKFTIQTFRCGEVLRDATIRNRRVG